MDFRRLEAFSKVHENRSFSKAADDLFLSQPTISAHISQLEKELNTRLFDRIGRSVLPTYAAEILYKYCLEIFQSLDSMKAEIELLQDRVTGSLAIGGSTIPAHYLLPGLLGKFKKKFPEVKVQLKVGDTSDITQMVSSGDLIAGVVGAVEEARYLTFKPILEDNLIVIAGKGIRLQNNTPSLHDLCNKPWVMREQGSGTRKTLESALATHDIALHDLPLGIEVESTQAVLQCVKSDMGLSVTSRLAARDFLERGEIVEIDVPELKIQRSFYCVFQERRYFFPVVRNFIEFLKKESATLTKEFCGK